MTLLTLAQAKTFGNISGTAEDAELPLYIDSVTDMVESILGGPVEQRTVTDTVDVVDGGRALALRTRFAVSVTSVTANGVAQPVADVYVAPGNVLRRKLGLYFVPCLPPMQATVVAGVAVPGSVPAALTLAAAMIVGHLYETQRGQLLAGPGDDYQTPTPGGMGFAVPNRALELLAPWMPDGPVIA